jgi:hypothetical protein
MMDNYPKVLKSIMIYKSQKETKGEESFDSVNSQNSHVSANSQDYFTSRNRRVWFLFYF